MNVKCIRTTILAALALAGGAQAGTNVVHSFDTEGYRKKALDLIRRADVPSLQVTMTSPEGVLSETDPERRLLAAHEFRGVHEVPPVVPARRGPLTDLFLRPSKRLYAHTGGVPLPAQPLGTVPTNPKDSNLEDCPLTNPKPWGLSPCTNPKPRRQAPYKS